MSHIIPGGRPRASSDGDILDESFCSVLFVNLNDSIDDVSRKNSQGKISANVSVNNNTSNGEYLSTVNDAFDSDGESSSHSQTGITRTRNKGLFFKSMRKAVSRAFVKDLKTNEPATKKSEKSSRVSDQTKVLTSNLRHVEDRIITKPSESSDTGTMSTSRPLITESSLGSAIPKWKKTPGTVGIYNHGNSCFMNAVLQCLSNTDSFTEYFVKDNYKNDLKNSSNGKKGVFRSNHGEVTEQLAHLLKCLWSGNYSSEVSKEFKSVVGKFNSQYKGDHQHDAQEFLLWLLDRIHEDVSTNSKKKVKPQKAPALRSDEELALEAASANGDSFVLKLFQALHSSTLICPTCGERSSTFDPYLCVSLPLPQRCPRGIPVIVVSLSSHHFHQVKMIFTMNQYDGVKELRELVANETKIPVKQLLLVQLKDDDFGSTYSDEQPVSDIPENEAVYAVEAYSDDASMQSSLPEFDTPTSQLLVMHVEVSGGSSHSHRFGNISMLKVRRDITWKNLQREILMNIEGLCEEILSQKLSSLFMIRVCDGSSRKIYLPSDVDMPLYTQPAERAYTALDEDFGPPHIKLIVEWDSQIKKTVILDDKEHIEIHPSVLEAQNNPPSQDKVSLDECFKLYTQEEKLIGDDAWLCPHCKHQQQGTIKTLRLWSLPDVLLLHLKRFKQNGHGRSKLNTLVEFPVENLDMSAHLTYRSQTQPLKRDDYCYDLLGVCNHYGNMMGGHYTAYCRSPVDGVWREFNDTKVHTLDGPVATREAYILFYQRRSLSKEINQRLFTGDHWVFSLPLAPSEMIDENLNSKTVPWSVDLNGQPRRSRSRSASPSAHRQNDQDGTSFVTHRFPTRPLTPQPVRHPIISYVDSKDFDDDNDDDDDEDDYSDLTSPSSPEKSTTSRRSRPVQRQVSAPGSQFRREKSAGAVLTVKLKDPSRTLYNRKSLDDPKDNFGGPGKRSATNGVARSHSQSRSKLIDKPPQVSVYRHEPPRSSDMAFSSSKVTSHQVNSDSLESDAMYPSTTYNHTKYLDTNQSSSVFEPAQLLQVNYDEKDSYSGHIVKSYHDSYSDSARKKLAHLAKQSTFNSNEPFQEEHAFVRSGSRVYGPLKNVEIDSNLSYRGGSSEMDTKSRDIEFKRDRWCSSSLMFGHRRTGYSLLEEPEDYFVDLNIASDHPARSGFRSKLEDKLRYQSLVDKSDGLVDPSKDNYRSRFTDALDYRPSDYISSHLNGDLSRLSKFATISRTSDASLVARYEKEIIPRSNTDHNIHYNNPSLAPPPSPTPPHSYREEQNFSQAISTSLPSSNSDYLTSGRLSTKDITSIQSYEFAGKRSGDQDTLMPSEIRTLPGPAYIHSLRDSRYFRRPRAVWGVKGSKPAPRSIGSIPTPCLRESSV